MKSRFPMVLYICIALFSSCANKASTNNNTPAVPMTLTPAEGESVATFASGCFWCVEEVFESLLGVREVISGYAGGSAEDANYEAVSTGRTKHAESIQVYYDTTIIDFARLTQVFFDSHDPTTLNQQGPDSGPQYRSVAFYRNDAERKVIQDAIDSLTASGEYADPIVTEVTAFTAFYPAEEYHQDYVERNPNAPYVRGVSKPRFEKFKEKYKGELKD